MSAELVALNYERARWLVVEDEIINLDHVRNFQKDPATPDCTQVFVDGRVIHLLCSLAEIIEALDGTRFEGEAVRYIEDKRPTPL